ncbi:kinase-like domain-containing protein [Glomus cerebriforme]|uniref:Kinase-like domain-containing protein n=1 Tax=Glomus cerebriforme TaxID=658196 RepID=A0A397TFC1_9GLOM|nr:kinase-like domain-containing protein [Glomus cerebriforme]
MYIIECYGITQDLHSNNYALVLKLKDCSLRSFLDKNYNSLTLKDKLYIIERICLGLDCIHNHNIIHRDLHLGNILYSINDKKRIEISISDFGFCKPAYENSSVPGKKIYGVMPYMAPEIWNGKEYTKESDIYSFGIIINEILSGSRPYQNVPHNINLALNICYGDRPNIRNGTPEPLKKLIQKCWDADIKNRPNTNQIYNMLRDFMYKKKDQGSYNFKEHTELYEKLQGSSHNMNDGTDGEVIMKDPPSKPQIFFSQAKYKSKFLNLPNLPAPVNSKSFMILKSGKFIYFSYFKYFAKNY